MKMTPVTSSNIAAMWYDLEKHELYIKFKNNKKFTYLGVTQEEYGRLINAESIGKHFNQFIKAVKVGREVITAENDTAENDTTPMSNAAMSDKEKIKVLREALELLTKSVLLSSREALSKVVMDSIDNANDTLLATKDGE